MCPWLLPPYGNDMTIFAQKTKSDVMNEQIKLVFVFHFRFNNIKRESFSTDAFYIMLIIDNNWLIDT